MKYRDQPRYAVFVQRQHDKTVCWGRCHAHRGYRGSTKRAHGYRKAMGFERLFIIISYDLYLARAKVDCRR